MSSVVLLSPNVSSAPLRESLCISLRTDKTFLTKSKALKSTPYWIQMQLKAPNLFSNSIVTQKRSERWWEKQIYHLRMKPLKTFMIYLVNVITWMISCSYFQQSVHLWWRLCFLILIIRLRWMMRNLMNLLRIWNCLWGSSYLILSYLCKWMLVKGNKRLKST